MEFSLAELRGYPPPPLTENHPAQKPLAEMGGTPPPLTESHCAQKSLAEGGGGTHPLTEKIR